MEFGRILDAESGKKTNGQIYFLRQFRKLIFVAFSNFLKDAFNDFVETL